MLSAGRGWAEVKSQLICVSLFGYRFLISACNHFFTIHSSNSNILIVCTCFIEHFVRMYSKLRDYSKSLYQFKFLKTWNRISYIVSVTELNTNLTQNNSHSINGFAKYNFLYSRSLWFTQSFHSCWTFTCAAKVEWTLSSRVFYLLNSLHKHWLAG